MSAASQAAGQRTAEASPFTAAELELWRGSLLEHRAALLREPRPDRDPDHDELLALIDRALAKIDGRGPLPFGLCEHTRRPIGRERLELMPWTPLSIEGATHLEENFLTLDDLLTDQAG
jgi:hypothetical protein